MRSFVPPKAGKRVNGNGQAGWRRDSRHSEPEQSEGEESHSLVILTKLPSLKVTKGKSPPDQIMTKRALNSAGVLIYPKSRYHGALEAKPRCIANSWRVVTFIAHRQAITEASILLSTAWPKLTWSSKDGPSSRIVGSPHWNCRGNLFPLGVNIEKISLPDKRWLLPTGGRCLTRQILASLGGLSLFKKTSHISSEQSVRTLPPLAAISSSLSTRICKTSLEKNTAMVPSSSLFSKFPNFILLKKG